MDLQVVSVTEAVAEELRRRLAAGEYRPGQELKDTVLSQEFSVARPTVRAAVQILVAEGLLDRGRGRSAQVRYFTAADAVDLYPVRTAIELLAVQLVLEAKPALDPVNQAVDAFLALPDDDSWDRVADADIRFHRAVIEVTRSPRLLRTFDDLTGELRLMIAQLRPAYGGAHELAAEHAALRDLLRSGRARPTITAWREHLNSAQRFFLGLMEQQS